MRERQQFEQLRIVVEHLLEMRHQPALVDRVAREAAAEMIVDAALADALERELDQREIALRRSVRWPARHRNSSIIGLRKFRRAAHAAMHRIDQAAELLRGAVELRRADHDPALGGRALSASRAISALRFCSMLCGSSRKTRATSRSTSTKAGWP